HRRPRPGGRPDAAPRARDRRAHRPVRRRPRHVLLRSRRFGGGMTLDTVKHAEATPQVEQPYRELGLKDDEYQRIREILGRRPTDAELAMYSVMWSEHCSYKSSKVHLRYFGETT